MIPALTNDASGGNLGSMGMNDCSQHNVPSTGRCYTCHKPFCNQCPSQDGCCSAQCAAGKARFSGLGREPRGDPLLPKLIKGAVLVGVVIAAIRYHRQIADAIGEFFK
jgi:hypothetical protein